MGDWLRNGVQLGWLIDPDKRQIFIYSKVGSEPDVVANVSNLMADGPVNGFTLDLEPIWSGLADL